MLDIFVFAAHLKTTATKQLVATLKGLRHTAQMRSDYRAILTTEA
jgi:hypothetical protein